jgi:SET domain
MSHVRKKTRATNGDSKSFVSTTQTGQTLDNLLVWLKQCGTKGLDTGGLEFRICEEDDGCGLGGFAQKDFVVGDVIFAVPLVCLISVTSAYDTAVTKLVRDAAIAFEDSSLVTSELLIWLFMIDQLADPSSLYYPYLRSLDSQSPSPLSWPAKLQSALVGTNISTMETSLTSLKRHAQFLDSVRQWATLTNRACTFMDTDRFNITTLLWARGHYLARRYPAKFSSENYSESDDLKSKNQGDGREEGMMNLGALVPLLDILNHNPEQEWLTFKVVNGYLNVTCNFPIKKGSEIFSNYGSLSNEMLLFAYGFCLEGNADDAITLQLMGSNQSAAG